MDTEDWVLKGRKLITNTKNQRLKIQSRGQIVKNTILQKKSNKSYNIYILFIMHIMFMSYV